MSTSDPHDIVYEEDGYRVILRMDGLSVELVEQTQDVEGNWIECPDDDDGPPNPRKRF